MSNEWYTRLPDKGTFIEVGAFDGETNSLTAILADKGWKGVCIEPQPNEAKKCRERHKNNDVVVLEMACDDRDGVITLSGNGQVATGSDEIKKAWVAKYISQVKNDWNYTITVQTKPLYWVRKALVVEPDLLVIDVEGMEVRVLEGWGTDDLPPFVIVETHEGSSEWMENDWARKHVKKIDEFFKGRKKTVLDDCNTLYEI